MHWSPVTGHWRRRGKGCIAAASLLCCVSQLTATGRSLQHIMRVHTAALHKTECLYTRGGGTCLQVPYYTLPDAFVSWHQSVNVAGACHRMHDTK